MRRTLIRNISKAVNVLTMIFLTFFYTQTIAAEKEIISNVEVDIVAQFEALLKENRDKVVYVDFWASWCTPCRKSFPVMNKWHNQFDKKNFKIITINVDAKKKNAEKFLTTTPADFHIMYDPEGKLARVFDVKGMPSSYIFGRENQFISSHTGFDTFKGLRLEKELEKLLLP